MPETIPEGYSWRVCQCGCKRKFLAKRWDAKYFASQCRVRVMRTKRGQTPRKRYRSRYSDLV